MSERTMFRLIRLLPVAIVAYVVGTSFLSAETNGRLLFFQIVAMPILFFLLAWAVRRSTKGDLRSRNVPERQPRKNSIFANCLGFGAIYGAVLLVALIVFANVTRGDPEPWQQGIFVVLVLAAMFSVIFYFLILPRLRGHGGYIRAYGKAMKGKSFDAVAAFEQHASRRPDDSLAQTGAAYGNVIRWHLLDALVHAQRGTDIELTADTLFMRGQALVRLGASDEALVSLVAAKEVGGNEFTDTFIGLVAIQQRRIQEAINYLEPAATGANVWGRTFLADAYHLAGYKQEALRTYRAAGDRASLGGKHFESLAAYNHARAGHAERAQKLAEKALLRDPRDVPALLALLYLRRADSESAWRTALGVALINPQAALESLSDPDLTHLMREERFRDLALACQRAREAQVEWARRVIRWTGGPIPPAFESAPAQQVSRWPTPEETWGSA